MAEAAEAKPVVEFTKVCDALFLSRRSFFFFERERKSNLSLSRIFFSPSAAIIILSL
jgi:hypothetical protein